MKFITFVIDIIVWIIFYTPSYIIGSIVGWTRTGYRDGKTSE